MKKRTIFCILIVLCLLFLTSCVPSKYRKGVEVESAYPADIFAIYNPAVVFDFEQTGNDFNLKGGTEESVDAVVVFYEDLLKNALITDRFDEGGVSYFRGVYKQYFFDIQVTLPVEKEAKAFETVFSMDIDKAEADYSENLEITVNYPEESFNVTDDSNVFVFEERNSGYFLEAGTQSEFEDIVQYYTEMVKGAQMESEDIYEGEARLSGYKDSYWFSIGMHKALEEQARAFKTVFNIELKEAMPNFENSPTLKWQVDLGGSGDEKAFECSATSDGGIIVVGLTTSSDGDVSGWHEGYNEDNATSDVWVVKLSTDSTVEWTMALGGSKNDIGYSVKETSDGGFVVAACTYSSDGDVRENKGDQDAWVIKLSKDGAVEWEKTYGGSENDGIVDIKLTQDNGYIAAGYAASSDGDASENRGDLDYWLIKLNANGDLEWEHNYGGSAFDALSHVLVMPDGSYTIGGFSTSYDGDSSGYGNLLIKLSQNGEVEWTKTMGGRNLLGFKLTPEGSYVLSGFQGPETGMPEDYTWGTRWSAEMEFELEMGFPKQEDTFYRVQDLAISADVDEFGRYIFAGYIGTTEDPADIWVTKLGPNSEPTDDKIIFGGSGEDIGNSIVANKDGSYIIAASTNSIEGDIQSSHGGWDICIIKLIHEYRIK